MFVHNRLAHWQEYVYLTFSFSLNSGSKGDQGDKGQTGPVGRVGKLFVLLMLSARISQSTQKRNPINRLKSFLL